VPVSTSGVADVAVVGAPHPRWQETPVAHVVLRPGAGATEAELIAHCRSHLAAFKCPTRIVFCDSLPRTATGKVQKFVLRDRSEPNQADQPDIPQKDWVR
jgi:acyl-CoA synthetase (AMP-forming)/AMP-acid ligase II